jgi:hypothetical protein
MFNWDLLGVDSVCGYSCSVYDTKVLARGKALVNTELSIAIPEGTYDTIGIPLTCERAFGLKLNCKGTWILGSD